MLMRLPMEDGISPKRLFPFRFLWKVSSENTLTPSKPKVIETQNQHVQLDDCRSIRVTFDSMPSLQARIAVHPIQSALPPSPSCVEVHVHQSF